MNGELKLERFHIEKITVQFYEVPDFVLNFVGKTQSNEVPNKRL